MSHATLTRNKLGRVSEDNAFEVVDLVAGGQSHITRIAILLIMGEDLDKRWSPSDMQRELVARGHIVKGAPPTLGGVSYHFRTLDASRWIARAGKPGRVRGALENFYRVDRRRV